MSKQISNSDDVLDSRNIIERIEELQAERDSYEPEGNDPETWAEAYTDEAEELAALEALQSEAEDYCPDWRYGATLVRDSYFKDYAQELAEDCGLLKQSAWPNNCIDWDRAARELRMDYTSVEFDGVTYWVQ
jgi:hypothetical protein